MWKWILVLAATASGCTISPWRQDLAACRAGVAATAGPDGYIMPGAVLPAACDRMVQEWPTGGSGTPGRYDVLVNGPSGYQPYTILVSP